MFGKTLGLKHSGEKTYRLTIKGNIQTLYYISIILPSICGRIHRVRAQAETKLSSENGIH